jgi:pimeloyl-ACP methyl ester carboxylesterase
VPEVEANGCAFYYEDDNFADPWTTPSAVVIQHGAFRSSRFWYHWVPELASKRRVIRRDLRGHGRSSDPGPGYEWSLDGQVEDLLAFLDALELSRVHLVGESLGGMIGAAFAAEHPARLHSLTLCSTPLTLGQGKLDERGPSVQNSISDFVQDSWDEGVLTPLDVAQRKWVKSEWERNPAHIRSGIVQWAPTIDLSHALGRIAVPTLLISPLHSPLTSPEEQQELHAAIRGSQLVPVDGYGHELYWDKPGDCLRILGEFLDECDNSSRAA